MNILELKQNRIITKEEPFMPAVFLDLPTALVGGGIATLSKEVTRTIDDRKTYAPVVCRNHSAYTHISEQNADVATLALSINDISF